MPGSEPTLFEALGDAKLRPLLITWSKRVYVDDQVDFLVDVKANRSAKDVYAEYIRPSAPKLINLADTTLNPIRELAKQGDPGYAKMKPLLSKAFNEMITFLKPTYATGGQAFIPGIEFQTYLNASRDPKVGQVMLALKISGSKAAAFEPLVTMYFKGRTVEDSYQAYLAMQKTVAKAKLDPALTAAGKPAADLEHQVAEAKAKQLALATAVKADQKLPAIRTELKSAKEYFDSAVPTLKAKGKPKDPIEVTRVWNSGRARMEKLDTAYLAAVKLDKNFSTRNSALATEKKKVDEQYAAFRKALGK
jgi:hypothetical protein